MEKYTTLKRIITAIETFENTKNTKEEIDALVGLYELKKDIVKLNLPVVSQQRELLSRFLKQYNQSELTVSDEIDIDLFLNKNKPT